MGAGILRWLEQCGTGVHSCIQAAIGQVGAGRPSEQAHHRGSTPHHKHTDDGLAARSPGGSRGASEAPQHADKQKGRCESAG